MERSIIHLNVADFAVAVERVTDPRLKHRPVIIAPEKGNRATVYDMSEEAYQTGVRKRMMLRKAKQLCADARVLPPYPDRYERAMHALFQRALPYSPLVETGDGDGHLFVDVTGTGRLFGPPAEVAWRLCSYIRKDLRLDPIWSVASNKLVAKVATRLVKPAGEYIVDAGEEAAFLAPLPIRLIPGIEHADLLKLQAFNLSQVFQVAALSLEHLRILLGNRATLLYESVRGIDPSPVLPAGEKPLQVVVDRTFDEDTNDAAALARILYDASEEAGRTLRFRRLTARRVGILLDYSDGVRHTRHTTATPATADDGVLFERLRNVLGKVWTRRVRIRRLRVICAGLIFPPAQLELFPADRQEAERRTRLVAAMDKIRNRFGRKAIRVGRMLVV